MMTKLINLEVFKNFLKSNSIGGIILMIALAVSLIIANTSLAIPFQNLLNSTLGIEPLNYSILLWINDGLMAIFFLLVGLEIKRELIEGELSSLKKASLPIFAAIGGMAVPAIIYAVFNSGSETAHGWGIPMATDIAFALAIVSLLSKSVPVSLKIFLAALAIVDDLGAILVIAIFYSNEIHTSYFYYIGAIMALLVAMNYFGVTKLIFYIIPGIFLWYFVHHTGIHATIAGVLLAFCIPTNDTDIESPLEKLEHLLHKPVNFIIMPIFALANTNITIENEMLSGLASPLGLGIFFGLIFGKLIGITGLSWIAVKLKISEMPSQATWKHVMGVGLLAGIGFTMSIFISMLSFSEEVHILEAKFAILVTSITAGLVGFIWLKNIKPVAEEAE